MQNNPIRYNDPSGHRLVEDYGNGGCSTSGYCPGSSGSIYAPTPTGGDDPSDNEDPDDILSGGGGDGEGTDGEEIEKLWPDNWFEVACSYTSSCVGQYVKYYTFSFGTAIPNPITGTVVGWHGSVTLTQYGDWLFGIGLDAGKNVFGVSASLVDGRFTENQLPKNDIDQRKFLQNFLTGNSFQGFLVPIYYIGVNYSPSVKTATLEDGIGIPQGGGAWTYTWSIKGGQP